MKRWIVRSFFIGLLLLSIGGWALSHKYHLLVESRSPERIRDALIWRGEFRYLSAYWTDVFDHEWRWEFSEDFWRHWLLTPRPSALGFRFSTDCIIIPLWSPTMMCGVVLVLAWRKSRPKAIGGAFPVEASKPIV